MGATLTPQNQGWIYWGRLWGEGAHTPQALVRWDAGGCYFHNKAEIYERHNEIHIIVIICHTVSLSIMFDNYYFHYC